MWRLVRAVWFVALLLFCSIPSRGQVRLPSSEPVRRTYLIRGSVRNGDTGQPLEMVKVELKRITGEVVATAFTRSNGEFEFSGLSNGVYYIVLEEKGYEPVREGIEILNSSRPGVFIFLRRPLEFRPASPGPTVTARELAIPRKAHDAMQKGLERLNAKQDYKGSLVHFQRAIAELPSYYEAYHEMGVAYLRLGQASEAEQAFRKSIEVSDNRYAEPHFALASLLSGANRFAEAEPLARRGIELDGNSWRGHFELAQALIGLNRLDAAEKSAQESRARNADFPQVHLLLANIHIRRADYPALLGDLDAYLKLEPSGPSSAQARETREKIQRALARAQSAPTPGPTKP